MKKIILIKKHFVKYQYKTHTHLIFCTNQYTNPIKKSNKNEFVKRIQ